MKDSKKPISSESVREQTGVEMDIGQVRQRFLQEYVTNRFSYYEQDAKRIRESDYWVKRFILHGQQGTNAAYYHIKDTFKWRKSFGLHDFEPLDIPSEIYQLAPVFDYLPDKAGCVPIYVRIKCLIHVEQLELQMKRFFVHLLDKVDNRVQRPKSWSLIFDCSNASLDNLNFDFMTFALEVVGKHFPLQPKYVLVYGLPWLLKPFVNIGTAMLPEQARDLLTFVDTQDQLFEIVAEANVPDFLGGKAVKEYSTPPQGSKSIFETGPKMYNLSHSECRHILNQLPVPQRDELQGSESSDGQQLSFIMDFD
ncbi:Motile sperm domain-containing protein 2 [Halotydeus destructor]|nr:Motile sperm domain-containing protein 2 [Halotydeus destructor]